MRVSSGEAALKAEIRSTLQQLVNSRLSVVDYASGRTRSLEAALRMNINEGVHTIYQNVQKQAGEKFGADGYEISAHADCAPDHLDAQGRQYSKAEFEKLQDELPRRIGQWNCRHHIYPIILGVSPRTYSDEELADLKARSLETFEYNGKQYTRYEGRQLQKRYDREIRKHREALKLARASGDKEWAKAERAKIAGAVEKKIKFRDIFVSGVPQEFLFSEISENYTIKDALKNINRIRIGKDKSIFTYRENCQRCVVAWEMFRRGFDVIAKGIPSMDDVLLYDYKLPFKGLSSADSNRKLVLLNYRNKFGIHEKDEIKRWMSNWGNGSRGVVYVEWEGDEFKGHVFCVENFNNNIIFIDPQQGTIGKPVEEYFSRCKIGRTELIRVDNVELTDIALDCVEPRRK